MNSLRLHAVGDLRLEQIPTPSTKSGEVLVRVSACGVCGSDLPRIFSKGTYRFPLACGHEFAGIVETVGDGVQRFASGDAVTVFPLIWCNRCPACEAGRFAQCEDYDYIGSRSDGAFAEYVVAPWRNLMRLPEGVTTEQAAFTEPAAVALHALRRAGGVAPGGIVVIFGVGPIGLMQAQFARTMGAGRVLLFDLVERKLEMARQLGFCDVFNPREVNAVGKTMELSAGRGAHVCVEGAGVPATLLQAVECARHNGKVIIMGNPSKDVTLPASLLSRAMRRELNISAVWNSTYSWTGADNDFAEVLRSMAAGSLVVDSLVSHRVSLADAPGLLARMNAGVEFFCKVLVTPWNTPLTARHP
ncbi:MAG: galactitol-1-phosphate 5-dehydrogenase [Candidatus Sumerlaeota bacterium]|nr:galactitol-1-phosphate 5-dehydrogenase [Candidatus Sumerlaeota bacterium]